MSEAMGVRRKLNKQRQLLKEWGDERASKGTMALNSLFKGGVDGMEDKN
jgi:hypothetical protein